MVQDGLQAAVPVTKAADILFKTHGTMANLPGRAHS